MFAESPAVHSACDYTCTVSYAASLLYIRTCRMYLGTVPMYHIADPDLLKEILVKHFDKFTNRVVRMCIHYTYVIAKYMAVIYVPLFMHNFCWRWQRSQRMK